MPKSKSRKRVLSRPLSDKFNEALVYAARLHREQPRKGKDIPYVGHLLGVASLVLESGGDEEMAIAALLHDAVEDQGGQPRLEEIRKRVRRQGGSHRGRLHRFLRSRSRAKRLPGASASRSTSRTWSTTADPEVRLVSIADKVHNARAVLADHYEIGDEVFTRFSKGKQGTLWYYRALVDAFRAAEARDHHPDDDAAQGRKRLMDKLDRGWWMNWSAAAGGRGVNPCRG